MLFKLDENLPRAAARLLREYGHDAVSALDQQMGGRPDEELSEAVKLENRAFITLDLDFSDIRMYPPKSFSGIVVLRPARQDVQSLVSLLRNLQPLFERERLAGRLWIVDEQRVRIRGSE
jgi:predicted nuclease of predicted toxin-antitoxin system